MNPDDIDPLLGDHTVETLRHLVSQRFHDLNKALDERHDTLVRALDERRDAQNRAVEAALQSAKEAVTKAELASEKRFEAVNEFRQTLSDQARDFATRVELGAIQERLTERIGDLSERVSRGEIAQSKTAGKGQGREQLYGWIAGGVGLVVGVISIVVVLSNVLTRAP